MKPKGRYEEITNARKILGIGEECTIAEIKQSFRDLIRVWHPDKSHNDTETYKRKSQEIIEAYRIIMTYCRDYKIPFTKESIDKYRTKEELWWEQYGNDPMWGPMKSK